MTKPLLSVPWTAEQDDKLRLLVTQRASIARASAALNRNMSSVRIRARKLGLTFPTLRETRKKIAAISQGPC